MRTLNEVSLDITTPFYRDSYIVAYLRTEINIKSLENTRLSVV